MSATNKKKKEIHRAKASHKKQNQRERKKKQLSKTKTTELLWFVVFVDLIKHGRFFPHF